MATLIVTPAQVELINSLPHEEIPIKLRCAICSRLAVNAFRLPCCDQAICETCQSTLPTTCPVCEHSPVSAEDCKPNKALRTTIKVFLRTEEKKREALRSKDTKETSPAVIPAEIVPPPAGPSIQAEPKNEALAQSVGHDESPQVPDQRDATSESIHDADQASHAHNDTIHPSVEEIPAAQQPLETGGRDSNFAEGNDNGVEHLEPSDENVKEGSHDQGASAGLDGMTVGGFPGMEMGGDFNQMQMLMSMQNGMGAGGFGNFPMMGMPGMNMDPMMMQNMFMNGGFGAGSMGMNGMNGMSGMNGMNMGMGMGGYDGGMGAGYNGWNGQQSWNVGPDNFNHPNAAGMMGHGDYRASNNSGYAQNAPGFNLQGNYGRPQYNDFQNNNYGNIQGYRGRGGRGRGFGRGGFGYGSQDFSHQVPQKFGQQQNGISSETGPIPTGPKPEAGPQNVDEFGRELRPKSESRVLGTEQLEGAESVVISENEPKDDVAVENAQDGTPKEPTQENEIYNAPMPIKSLDEENAAAYANNGYSNSYGQGLYSQTQYGGGRNGFSGMQPPVMKPVDVPINAPTGPKAMREGLPNTGYRGRQFPVPNPVNLRANGSVNDSVAAASEKADDRQATRSPSREPSRDPSREGKRSRSRERRSRRHRDRSESLSEDEKETERRRERRRERRKRREEEEARDDTQVEEETRRERKEESRKEVDKSRSASPSEHKRSSHRSRRDKDKYRERERDRDRDRDRESDRERDHKSSSHRHRSHRSHRDDRSRSRDRDRDRDHRHRHSRRESTEPLDQPAKETRTDENDTSRRPSVVSTSTALEIKGVSSRRKPLAPENIPTGPRSDRIEKEREKSSTYQTSSSRHRDSESRPSRDNRDRNREAEKDRESKQSKSSAQPTSDIPTVDPHTLEREARNRERLLKEAQRMASMTGGAGRKRSRDEGDVDRKGVRKKGRRGGTVNEDHDEEARIAKLEAEREGARWV